MPTLDRFRPPQPESNSHLRDQLEQLYEQRDRYLDKVRDIDADIESVTDELNSRMV